MTEAGPAQQSAQAEDVRDVHNTTCSVVGGGPAGMMLSLLLARQGVSVTLLEAHHDFDRDFRGDTIHPSTLEILDQLGLADRLLQIPHGEVRSVQVHTREGAVVLADFHRIKTRFPFIAMLPQAQFLDFLAAEAKKFPAFRLVLGANVQRLVRDGEVVAGVCYRGADDRWHEVRAPLTVAAGGRFSKVRGLLGLEPVKTTPPMDVVWFRLPRRAGDPPDSGAFYIHRGHFVVVLDRADEWQIGYIIFKGGFHQLREAGVEALRRELAETVPWLADRVGGFTDWKQASVLSVESSRLKQWYAPGVLLIGDAAHVMSPVGGVGINYAIQDAVEAANLLGGPLKEGRLQVSDLAAVQKLREGPAKAIQRFQGMMQRQIAAPALQAGRPFRLPWWMRIMQRLPWLRDMPARMVAFGVRRVRVRE